MSSDAGTLRDDRGRQPRPATLRGDAPADDAIESPQPGNTEQALDEMLVETFPASDAPQLDGRALHGSAAANAVPAHPLEHPPPPEVAAAASEGPGAFDREQQRYPLGSAGSVVLETTGGEVHAEFSNARMTLDAPALEQLIAALERHRPSLHAR